MKDVVELFPELGEVSILGDGFLIPNWKIMSSSYQEAVEMLVPIFEKKKVSLSLEINWDFFQRGKFQRFVQGSGMYLPLEKDTTPVFDGSHLGLFEMLMAIYQDGKIISNGLLETSDRGHFSLMIYQENNSLIVRDQYLFCMSTWKIKRGLS